MNREAMMDEMMGHLDNLPFQDIYVVLTFCRYLVESTHENPLFDPVGLALPSVAPELVEVKKLAAKPRETGTPFPEDVDTIEALRAETFEDKSFIDWLKKKGTPWNVEEEWERFVLHAVLNKRRFKGKELRRSTRIAFMAWLSTPFKSHMLSDLEQKKKAIEDDPELGQHIIRAKELYRQAASVSRTSGKHVLLVFRGLCETEGIEFTKVKDKV